MIVKEIEGFFALRTLKLFRKTEGVVFDIVPHNIVKDSESIDRVIHKNNAVSPGSIGEIERPWYMHPNQSDNLVVFQGHRNIELYSRTLRKKVKIELYPNKAYIDGVLVSEEGVILSWEYNIFHRIISGDEGSSSLNFAIRKDGFNIKTNFNIYDLNEETGEFKSIREGFKDQL